MQHHVRGSASACLNCGHVLRACFNFCLHEAFQNPSSRLCKCQRDSSFRASRSAQGLAENVAGCHGTLEAAIRFVKRMSSGLACLTPKHSRMRHGHLCIVTCATSMFSLCSCPMQACVFWHPAALCRPVTRCNPWFGLGSEFETTTQRKWWPAVPAH